MNCDNLINIPVTNPVIRYPYHRIEAILKGYFSNDNKVYVVRHIQATTMFVELKTYNYQLKGFWRVLFAITLIGPAVCALAICANYAQRKWYRYRMFVVQQAQEPAPRLHPNPPVNELFPVVNNSIKHSSSLQMPLAPKFYITNILKALNIYLEADPTLKNYKLIQNLYRDKSRILEEVINELKIPEPRRGSIYSMLEEEFDKDFGSLINDRHLKMRICLGIVNQIPTGHTWFSRMETAFCELIEALPDDLESLKKEKIFLELKDAVEKQAACAIERVLDLPRLTRFRDVYDVVAVKLGLPPMNVENFTENDEKLAEALQVLE